MSRSVSWRRSVSDLVSWRQDQAQNSVIYILREIGPTGFLLKEEGEAKKLKVFLGDPHTCTCPDYKKERDLCKHICWILLKKFRIPREDQLSFQFGLVEREINELLRGRTKQEQRKRAPVRPSSAAKESQELSSDGKEILEQRPITEDDVCPICQDELLGTREPVTYCRYGCAKSIHIKCMKVWADHQRSTGELTIKCPLCREDFGEIEVLQKELRNASLQKTRAERGVIHMGMICSQCNQSPIAGRCYKCTECRNYHLCQTCFTSNIHSDHSFQFRQKPNQRWRPAQRSSGTALPQAVLEDIQNRDIQEEDYELLLQLDSQAANQPSAIPESVVKAFPTERVRQGGALMAPGIQCRVCLRGYTPGQIARKLPCKHKFHSDCIDQWLLHEHPTCPIDGTVVWNPITAQLDREEKCKRRAAKNQTDVSQNIQGALEIPGVGVAMTTRQRLLEGRSTRKPLGRSKGAVHDDSNNLEDRLASDFQLMGLGISSSTLSSRQEQEDGAGTSPGLHNSGRKQGKIHKFRPTNLSTRNHALHSSENWNLEDIVLHSESVPRTWTASSNLIDIVANANEQRLPGNEQRSHANEHRLHANEQRLDASEQRLHVSEQRLRANEQHFLHSPLLQQRSEAQEARLLRDYSLFNLEDTSSNLKDTSNPRLSLGETDAMEDVLDIIRNEGTSMNFTARSYDVDVHSTRSDENYIKMNDDVTSLALAEEQENARKDVIPTQRNVNMNTQLIQYQEPSQQLCCKPPIGIKGQKGKPPLVRNARNNHIASVPALHNKITLSTVGHRAEGVMSAPSASRQADDNERKQGDRTHRGRSRRRRRSAGRRLLSSSPARSSSTDRLHVNPVDKQEILESMFLGSSTGKLLSSRKRGNPRRQVTRASSLPSDDSTRREQLVDMFLAGSCLTSAQMSD